MNDYKQYRAHAAISILAHQQVYMSEATEDAAKSAVAYADALIAELERTEEEELNLKPGPIIPQPEPPADGLPRLGVGWRWAQRGEHAFTGFDVWFTPNGKLEHSALKGSKLTSPTPLATPDWHNPENIESPGDGYRFLVKGENKLSGDQLHMGKCSWKPSDLLRFPSVEVGQTYRTPATRPLPPVLADEKEAQP